MGANLVTCTATDHSGNTAWCSFTITVIGELIATTNDVVNLRIPDGSPVGLANSVNITTPIERITDVNVSLVVTGGFNGDLHAYLVHNSGHAILLNRAGKTLANPSGYSDPGFNVTFDDHATNSDAHTYRLVLFGNIDIRALEANDKEWIEKELQEKILPVVRAGGRCMLHSDHSISPRVDYETYAWFVERARELTA